MLLVTVTEFVPLCRQYFKNTYQTVNQSGRSFLLQKREKGSNNALLKEFPFAEL